MSVPVSKRTLSDMEFFNTACKLRLFITNLLLKDFGIKDKIRNLQVLSGMKGMHDEDFSTLKELAAKYNLKQPLLEKFPYWLIDYLRNNLLELLRKLIQNITGANTIYVTCEREYYDRRHYQTEAIINCEQILQEMQYILEVIPCDVNKFMPHVELIQKEIALLKGWRKSDNRLLTKLRKDNSNKSEG